jgi:ribonucleoside-diphosphate reductase alpha chain
MELAAERGAFPLFPVSVFGRRGEPARRNAQLLSIAPTGTISVIAGTTSGIEPMFAIAYARNVLDTRPIEVNPLFEHVARARGFHSDELMAELVRTGGVRGLAAVPEDVRAVFPSAHEIDPAWHLKMQATVQRYVDAGVSKTVNLPSDAGVDEVRRLCHEAWRAGVKGITVYRYGSRSGEVLSFLGDGPIGIQPARAGGCAGRACDS